MKEISLEQRLISVNNDTTSKKKQDFTAATLKRIKQQTFLMKLRSSFMRKTNVIKKETFVMKLQQMPKLAAIAAGVVGMVALSGTAYAIHLLWPQPQVSTDQATQNQYGRTQLVASFKECADRTNSMYEIKKDSALSASEVEKVLQAKCEMESIEKWATEKGYLDSLSSGLSRAQSSNLSFKAATLTAIDDQTLSVSQDADGGSSFKVDGTTKFYVAGEVTEANAIKPGDVVLYIYKEGKISHLIKVDLAENYYSPALQNQIIERKTCEGNENDTCVDSGFIDLYSGAGRPSLNRPDNSKVWQNIQGTLRAHTGNTLTIKTSSGRTLQLVTPSDVITVFNLEKSSNFNNLTVEVGDMLDIRFISTSGDVALDETEILSIGVMTDFIDKGDQPKKY